MTSLQRNRGRRLVGKPRRSPVEALKRPATRRRRKKGTLTKIKLELWQLCRALNPETTCYTCGRQNLSGSNRQLGHFIAASLCSPELRFDLKNLRVCCYNCNINKSGNTLQFERNLIRDHGVEYVAELWLRNEQTKGRQYPLSFFKEKITEYQKLAALKEMEI